MANGFHGTARTAPTHNITLHYITLHRTARSAPSAASSSAHSRSRSTSRRWAVTMASFGGNAQPLVDLTSSARARSLARAPHTRRRGGAVMSRGDAPHASFLAHDRCSRGAAGTTVISRPFLSFVGARSRSQGMRHTSPLLFFPPFPVSPRRSLPPVA